MKNTFLLFISLFITCTLSAQNGDWVNRIQHSNKVNLREMGDISTMRWAKHLERYRWKEYNALDEEGFIIPQNERVKNFLKQSNNRSLNTNGNWTPIGLESWTNGNSGYNPGNGRINAVTIDPNNPQTIFACAASGGVWKSIDGGESWNTNTDQFPVLGTSDVAIDPTNSDIVYLGTGDRDASDTYGVGVYKSTDGGASWEPSGLFNQYASDALIINAIEIDPNNTNIIYAGSNEGLYKSEDAGENWNKVISFGSIMEIKVNPENSQTVFAVSKNFFYRSHDGGENFQTITSGLQSSIGRIAMDITPADTSYIYLLIADGSSNFNGVYQSTDGGSSFNKKVGLETINLLGYDTDGMDDASQAWYDLAIAVSDTDENRIYTGGINVWTSGDGGSSWENSSRWSYYSDATYAHADIHSLDTYGDVLVCGSDGGAFKNVDNSIWENISNGLNISQIYKFSNSINGSKISTGCQDNGTNVSDNGDWTHVKGADGMATLINPSNPNIVYLSSQYGNFYKSSSGGDNNSSIFHPESYDETGSWVTPISICKDQPTNLVIGLENVFKTSNSGNTWTKISDFNDGQNFSTIVIAPSNPNFIYGAKVDHVYYTSDGGATWNESTFPSLKPVADIIVSETNPEEVYFLKSSGFTKIYRSENGGQTVSTMFSSIPQTSSNALIIENNELNGMYVGTQFGVYYNNDELNEWVLYSDQLPRVKVTDLEIVNDKLRAATYGRGVWESDLYSSSTTQINSLAYKNLNIYPNPTDNYLFIESDHLNVEKIQIFNTSGILVKAYNSIQKNYSVENLVTGAYFVRVQTKEGEVIIKQIIKQ